jgi:hypothetical protein
MLGLMCALLSAPAFCADIYFNDFSAAPGTTYPEWTSTGYTNSANRAGIVAAGSGPQTVATVASPNGKERFLGEFGPLSLDCRVGVADPAARVPLRRYARELRKRAHPTRSG